MPHINTWEKKGVLRKFTGNIQAEEILSSNFALHEHPGFAKIAYIINDFSEITGVSLDSSHTKIYASTDDIISETKGKFNIAIVVNQDALADLANSYRNEMKNRYFKCEIFKTVEDARKWVE